MKMKSIFVIILAAMVIFASCSSSSKNKNAGDVYQLRIQSERLLESGNKEAYKGNLDNAFILLSESKRLAVLSDDLSLIARNSLSRGNVLFSLGRTDEAFADWEQAVSEAQKLGNSELISASRIFLARGKLLSGAADAQSVLNDVNREQPNIKSNRLYIAFSWQVKGFAQRALNSYRDAEDSIRRSLEIHEKDGYLENASYDWYTIASIRSLSGNTTGALQALETSIAIDRRIENSWGLAASWRAMGDVYRKAGREQDAQEAYQRSRSIFEALKSDYEAAEIEKRIRNENE
jgi:tetratricopeptide (TPR) repeat protein